MAIIDPDLPVEFDDGTPCEIIKVTSNLWRKNKYGRQLHVVANVGANRNVSMVTSARDIGFFNEFGGEFSGEEGNPNYRTIRNVGPVVIEDWRL